MQRSIVDRAAAKHNELVKQLTKTRAKRDKTITTLTRLEAKLNSLIRAVTRSQKRLDKARVVAQVNAPMDNVFADEATMQPAMTEAPTDPLEMPTFLRRDTAINNMADIATAAALAAEAEDKKKAKKKGQDTKRKAKLSGETRKMPLTGKAAADYINQV
jgi:hypothetical protein